MAFNTDSFKNWLRSKSYSKSTILNYLADVNKYLMFVGADPSVCPNQFSELHPIATSMTPCDDAFIFLESSLSVYLNQLSPKSYKSRALASLSKFCQFALDQHIISTNPLKNIIQNKGNLSNSSIETVDEILTAFKIYLKKHNKSDSTVTNYINDIKQFIIYTQKFET